MEREKFFLCVSVVDEHGNPVVQSHCRQILLAREFRDNLYYPAHVGNFYMGLVEFCANASHAAQVVDGLTAFSRSNYEPHDHDVEISLQARVSHALDSIACTIEAARGMGNGKHHEP